MDLLPIIQSLPPELQQALAKDGFEAVKALASCIYKSCGQLLLPWQMVRVAQAESKAELIKSEAKANSIRMIGQAISEYPELGIKFNGNLEELNINNTDLKALETRANIRINQQQLRKQKNLENVVGKAYNELIGKKIDSNVEIDEDLIIRFFDDAENISDDQVQTLWARILAGEVLKPRTYSYRFLSVLKNISKQEFDIIQKIAPLICENAIIKDYESLKYKGITKQDISILDDMGIIKDQSLQIRGAKLHCGYNHILFKTSKYAFVLVNKTSLITNYMIDVLELTETGKKLFGLTDYPLDFEYMEMSLCKKIIQYPNLSLFASEITGIENGVPVVSNNHIFEINM